LTASPATKKERTSDDADTYGLIMKNKEQLLSRAEPVRFIFSHSALREGWDNPNVFQICTLKKSHCAKKLPTGKVFLGTVAFIDGGSSFFVV